MWVLNKTCVYVLYDYKHITSRILIYVYVFFNLNIFTFCILDAPNDYYTYELTI